MTAAEKFPFTVTAPRAGAARAPVPTDAAVRLAIALSNRTSDPLPTAPRVSLDFWVGAPPVETRSAPFFRLPRVTVPR